MGTRSFGIRLGVLSGIVWLAGCASAPPCPPPPPPPPPPVAPLANCVESATIIYWVEAGQHKAKVYGNTAHASEEKNLYVDGDLLTPGQSEICWNFVPLPPANAAQLQWVHVKDFSHPIFAGNGQFDPNVQRGNRQRYNQPPAFGSIEYPQGSGQMINGVRVSYKVWIKLQGGTAPFEADPEIVIRKPGG